MPRATAVTRQMQRALVERAQAGDLDAFMELVKAFTPRLHRVANLILHDIDRAQDAVQDALLMGWRDLRALREPDAFEAWLRRLTVRACYGVARKERRRNRAELHVTPSPETTFTGISVGAGADATLVGNTVCGNGTNLEVADGAEMPDTTGNEICADASTSAAD